MKFKHSLPLLSLFLLLACNSEDLALITEQTQQHLSVQSHIITLDKAKSEIEGIIGDIGKYGTRAEDTIKRKIADTYFVDIPYQNPKTLYTDTLQTYIINFEKNKGFAIMSSDKRFPALLAYAEEGNLQINDTIDNPGIGIFLAALKPHIDNIVSTESFKWAYSYDLDDPNMGGTDGHYEYGEWENTVYPSLCPVKWDQYPPYNKYCPIVDGSHALTGCVATAVAQLMAVYKYPSSYNGYSFNWNKMTENQRAEYCSQLGIDNIARLMQQLGLPFNLNMSYGVKASGARMENVPRTLISFGYSNPGVIKDYSTSIVVDDLQKGYAVLAGGYHKEQPTEFGHIKNTQGKEVGHLWLLHGLLKRTRPCYYYDSCGKLLSTYTETQWYPLCNWGWDGNSDGYFLSGVFDTAAMVFPESMFNSDEGEDETRTRGNYNFQYYLRTITGIRK